MPSQDVREELRSSSVKGFHSRMRKNGEEEGNCCGCSDGNTLPVFHGEERAESGHKCWLERTRLQIQVFTSVHESLYQ